MESSQPSSVGGDIVVRMDPLEPIPGVETYVVSCAKGHLSELEDVCNVSLCLGG